MALLITPLWLASAAGWASWVAVHWLTGGLRPGMEPLRNRLTWM